ncbi:helix-turn-helix domain-containing protein [Roseburia sp. AM51-8]|nr:helix-turn-helix domain-containing protein [Roseburia sp. AM51-8]
MTDLRIEKAKEMLTYNNISLTDLSAKLHFSTPSYFSSVFKKRTGLPPSAYVQSLSKPASSSQP